MYYVAHNFIIYVIFINAFIINIISIQAFLNNILLIYNNIRVRNILLDHEKYT